MKRISPLLALIAALVLAIPLASCSNGVSAYSDTSKTIDIQTSKEFVILIALESNPTTGYSWQAKFDTTALDLIEQTYELREYTKENIVGAGGTELFRFKALKSGSYQIQFDYQRPWEKESIDTKTFTVDIK